MAETDRSSAVDLLGRLGEAGITGASDIIGKMIEATGRFFEGIATNPDPLTQGTALVLAVITINFFLSTDPYRKVLDKLGLTALYSAWAHFLISEIDLAGKTLVGRDDAAGLFGIEGFDGTGALVSDRWYTNPASRDVAWALLTIAVVGNIGTPSPLEFIEQPNVKALSRVSRAFVGGGIIVYPTPLPPPPDNNADAAIATWKVATPHVAGSTWYVVVAQTDAGNWIVVNTTQDQTQAQTILNLTYGQTTINNTKVLRTVII